MTQAYNLYTVSKLYLYLLALELLSLHISKDSVQQLTIAYYLTPFLHMHDQTHVATLSYSILVTVSHHDMSNLLLPGFEFSSSALHLERVVVKIGSTCLPFTHRSNSN